MRWVALVALLVVVGAAQAGKFRHHEVQEGDGTNNYQIYILGDGWRHDEMDKYHAAVNSVVEGLFKVKPYDYVRHMIRITCVDVASDVKGVKIFEAPSSYKENPGEDREKISKRDSPLGVTFQDTKSDPDLSSAAAKVKEELGDNWGSIAIILINEPQIEAGVAKNLDDRVFVGVSAFEGQGADVSGVLAHEMGHAFFRLADEYCDGRARQKEGKLENEPPNITMTTEADESKWRHIPGSGLVACQAPGPDNGWKHGFNSCRMQRKGAGYKDFCAVCLEAMTHEASAKYKPIVSWAPADSPLTGHAFSKYNFKVTLRGATREYARVWSVNGRSLGEGQVQTNATGSTSEVTLGYPSLGTGVNKVTFMVEDRRNVLLPVGEEAIRKVPHTVSWWVFMAGPPHLLPGISPLLGWP